MGNSSNSSSSSKRPRLVWASVGCSLFEGSAILGFEVDEDIVTVDRTELTQYLDYVNICERIHWVYLLSTR